MGGEKRKLETVDSIKVQRARISASLQGLGFPKELVAQALEEVLAGHDSDEFDPNEWFDEALEVCNQKLPVGVDEDDQIENREIDQARVIALETAESEREKRQAERKCTWIVANILVLDELNPSCLLRPNRDHYLFKEWCGKLLDSGSNSRKSRQNQASGQGSKSNIDGLKIFREHLAEMLILESDARKWYGDHSTCFFTELGEALHSKLPPKPKDRSRSNNSSSDCMAVIFSVIDWMIETIESMKTGLFSMPERDGQIPTILVDAQRRRCGEEAASLSRGAPDKPIVLD